MKTLELETSSIGDLVGSIHASIFSISSRDTETHPEVGVDGESQIWINIALPFAGIVG